MKHKNCYPHFTDKFSLSPLAPANLFIALEVCTIYVLVGDLIIVFVL